MAVIHRRGIIVEKPPMGISNSTVVKRGILPLLAAGRPWQPLTGKFIRVGIGAYDPENKLNWVLNGEYQNMKIIFRLSVALLCYNHAVAQDSTITVRAGAPPNETIPAAFLYQYPEFVNGNVLFRNGTVANVKLNYNIFLREMHFINTIGDTLTIDNEETIRLVRAANDTFYYDKGYRQLLLDKKSLKLAETKGFKILDKQKESEFKMQSSVSSIKNVNSYTDGIGRFQINTNETAVLVNQSEFYFGDEFNHFVPANKKKLFGMFPNQKTVINNYLKENNTDFRKKEDVEKLFYFLLSL